MSIIVFPDKIMIGDFTLTEVGDGFLFDGKVELDELYETGSFRGRFSGYTSGGSSPTLSNVIDKFPFASNSNATDTIDLVEAKNSMAGMSSAIAGFVAGGTNPSPSIISKIDRFYFNSSVNSVNIGDLAAAKQGSTGHSSASHGYVAGGETPTPLNVIEKFSFDISTTVVTNVGTLGRTNRNGAGQSSYTNGYVSGGETGSPATGLSTIEKFSFASDGNSSDVGTLIVSRPRQVGQSSDTSGYTSGGFTSVYINTIERFPFSSDTNSTDVGDLTLARGGAAGQSSTDNGYTSGGIYNSPGGAVQTNVIDKFPFAANLNASSVGNLSLARFYCTGHQH